MTKRILITGGAGFIGSHVVEECLRRGLSVTVLDSLVAGRADFIPPGVEFIRGDVRGKSVLPAGKFDYVIHLAALPFIPDCYNSQSLVMDVNATGTLNILQRCEAWGVDRVLVVSSSEVYGTAQQKPMREDHPTNTQSTYAVSKLAAEKLALTMWHEKKIPAIVIRPFNTFGPRTLQPYIIPEIISQANRGDVIRLGNIKSVRDFSYVADTARAMVELLERGKVGEVYHYGSGIPRSIENIVSQVEAAVGFRLSIETDSAKLRPNDVTWLEANNAKIDKVINNHGRTSFEAGIAQTIQWFQSIGCKWPWEG